MDYADNKKAHIADGMLMHVNACTYTHVWYAVHNYMHVCACMHVATLVDAIMIPSSRSPQHLHTLKIGTQIHTCQLQCSGLMENIHCLSLRVVALQDGPVDGDSRMMKMMRTTITIEHHPIYN